MTNADLKKQIKQIKTILFDIAQRRSDIQDCEENYAKIYYIIEKELSNRGLPHENNYSSLWEFYDTFGFLQTYQGRRTHIIQLYKTTLKKLNLLDSISSKNILNNSFSMSFDEFHPQLQDEVKNAFNIRDYNGSVHKSLVILETKVRNKGSFKFSQIGTKLMRSAFNIKSTPFVLPLDKGEAEGIGHLFTGVIGTLKNKHSHRSDIEQMNEVEAFKILGFVSYLLSFVEDLKLKEKDTTTTENKETIFGPSIFDEDDLPF